jgi:hypothetical protein
MDDVSRLAVWETPVTYAFYPSVTLIVHPFNLQSRKQVRARVIVAPDGIDKYPKYLIDFGESIVATHMDESCCPKKDFANVVLEMDVEEDKYIAAFQWLGSPWLKSYEPCFDPYGKEKYGHYLIFGGDSNVEVISCETPRIEKVDAPVLLSLNAEI